MISYYKKGLLSLAAVMALGTAVYAAEDYIPMAEENRDYNWVLFGVDGFVGTSLTSEFDVQGTQLEDTAPSDDSAVYGLGLAGAELGAIKALPGLTSSLTALTINVNVNAFTFKETEPMRTMFITMPTQSGSATEPNVMFSYKASLEGSTIELQNGDTTKTYTTTISSMNTYDNSAVATTKSVGSSTATSVTIKDSIDYDFSNNPADSSRYTLTNNQDLTGGANTRVYSYDAIGKAWNIYDSDNIAFANDIDSIRKGVGYWGRMDLDGSASGANADNVPAGMVMGSGGLNDSDYADNNLSEGWNMMSFSSLKPDIINSATGLLISNDTVDRSTDIITIYDSTGVNKVAITVAGATTTLLVDEINNAIQSAKRKGELADSFDLVAFLSDDAAAPEAILLLSNKRFFISTDTIGMEINPINPDETDIWNETDLTYEDVSAGVAVNDVYGSSYGNYTMVIAPEVDAANLDAAVPTGALRSAAIQVNSNDTLVYTAVNNTLVPGDHTIYDNLVTDFGTVLAAEENAAGSAATGGAIPFDIDNDGTNDRLLVVSDTPFYLRDHTFIRVLKHSGDAGGTQTISGGQTGSDVTYTSTAAAAGTATNILAGADTNVLTADHGIYAEVDGGDATKFIAVSSTKGSNLFDIRDNALDQFSDSTSTDLMAKGAVSDVHTVEGLVKKDVGSHVYTIEFTTQAMLDAALDNATIDICLVAANTDTGVDYVSSDYSDDDGRKASLDDLITEIQVENVGLNNADIRASHDFNASFPVYPVTLTVDSFALTGFGINWEPGIDTDCDSVAGAGADVADPDEVATEAAAVTAALNNVKTDTGDSTTDLKYNAVMTKNYAHEGPVYTMKEAGYTIERMVSGITNLEDGKITWDSLDLTRTAQEMFNSRDFNLFTTDPKYGYWVYLQENAVTDVNDLNITASGSTLVEAVKHHFDEGEVIARNHIDTDITVLVSGDALKIPDTGVASIERVWASVGGTTVELVGDPKTGLYTADINSYAMALPSEDIDVVAYVSNGEGWVSDAISIGTIDNVKPVKPVISLAGGFSVTSTSTDVAGFYIYQNNILESDMHAADVTATGSGNYIGHLTSGTAGIDFCASDAIKFDSKIALKVVAVDGSGTFTTGNISDIATTDYYAIEKGSNYYEHLGGSGDAADQLGLAHGADCSEATADNLTDNGISVKSATDQLTVKLAMAPIDGVTFDIDIPYTIYVKDGSTGNIAEIKFSPRYLGKPFYIQFTDADGTKVYTAKLPANYSGGAATTNVVEYDISGNAADMTTASSLGSTTFTVSGQSF